MNLELDPQSDECLTDSEFKLWAALDPRQKSYTVEVLHWFRYRPQALRASWTREEVLTWELLRALEVLPRSLFLRSILAKIVEANEAVSVSIQPLLDSDRVRVTPYPSLGLAGGKRNCRSDIGLGLDGMPTVWIEAKTASFKASDLKEQLEQQASAMAALLPGRATALITLLPSHRALSGFPNLSWGDVEEALRFSELRIGELIPDASLAHGYCLIARELRKRIATHPNREKGWV
jgi:hypothetical protein